MKKITFLFLLFLGLGFTHLGYSQSANSIAENQTTIDGVSIYPNPVSTGKIYIISNKNFTKDIEIFDVLGKKIFTTTLVGKELNVSKLSAGIYILKIKENNISTCFNIFYCSYFLSRRFTPNFYS